MHAYKEVTVYLNQEITLNIYQYLDDFFRVYCMLVLVQYNETSNDYFMKILVTGGNGFIATNFIKLALHEKYSVTSLDNPVSYTHLRAHET